MDWDPQGVDQKGVTSEWLRRGGSETEILAARKRERRRGVWQPRYWEHTFESAEDFARHFDDLHDNPVEQRYVRCPQDWRWSTFHRRVLAGVYPPNWACVGRRPFTMNFDDIAHRVGDDP